MSIEIANNFLAKYKMRADDFDLKEMVEAFIDEMEKGLKGLPSSLLMLPTYIEAENEFHFEKPVIAIDAGGTNFRAAVMHFNKDGELVTDHLQNRKMPGLTEEVSRDEFFQQMASCLHDYAELSDHIGFCFSYAAEVLPNKDGRILHISKEIKAKDAEGALIGENLLKAMGTPEKKIIILNDTVSTLLAGKSASAHKTYDSFIGFILGTGTNVSYIEQNSNIIKTKGLDPEKSQIINIESCDFNLAARSAIDIAFDNETSDPGMDTFEKMFSGAYFGGLCLQTLKVAADEGVFSEKTSALIKQVDQLSSEDANSFTFGIAEPDNPLKEAASTEEDAETICYLIDALIERAAKLAAGNLAAVVLKTGKGREQEGPVLITIEGTTYYKLKGLQIQFESYLKDFLSGDKQRYFETIEVEQSSLVGAALAALVN
ncbi:hexokinase family protein [Sunxiuqinia sp. A32]|uniref:hexokinase family protein n=1 Tax=Sunxiuqinia sp. A32 TaxID=3461496 RepID=UPI004045F5A5